MLLDVCCVLCANVLVWPRLIAVEWLLISMWSVRTSNHGSSDRRYHMNFDCTRVFCVSFETFLLQTFLLIGVHLLVNVHGLFVYSSLMWSNKHDALLTAHSARLCKFSLIESSIFSAN